MHEKYILQDMRNAILESDTLQFRSSLGQFFLSSVWVRRCEMVNMISRIMEMHSTIPEKYILQDNRNTVSIFSWPIFSLQCLGAQVWNGENVSDLVSAASTGSDPFQVEPLFKIDS